MSTQEGIFKLRGSMDGFTFYKAYGKHLVRKTSGPSKEQIMTEPNYQRARENASEFGGCSKISKAFRESLHPLKYLTDGQFGNRLTKLFKFVIPNDEGVPGERSIKLSSHREAFADFECNIKSKLSRIVHGAITISHNENRTLATVTIQGGRGAVEPPEGVTHFQFVHALAIVSDFIFDSETRSYLAAAPTPGTQPVIQHSDYYSLEDATPLEYTSTVSLPVTTPLPDTVSVLHALGIRFFQRLGSINYPFTQGQALKILEVF